MEALALAEGGACGVFSGGTARCWGRWYGELLPESTAAESLAKVVELRIGDTFIKSQDQLLFDFFCSRFFDGSVRCWGNGYQGQLGRDVGAGGGVMTPTAIEGMPPSIVGIALGWRHACAWTSAGEAVCWGNNEEGQLGIGAVGEKVVRPSSVQLPGKVTQLVSARTRTCALLEGGDVYCWGEFWNQNRGVNGWWPTLIKDARRCRELSAASSTICGVRLDGAIACWGYLETFLGPIEQLSTKEGSAAVVPGIDDATAVAVGYPHACAIRRDATLWCWGTGDAGELGDGRRTTSWKPVQVPLPGPVVRVVAGKHSTCARLADHRWFCWGANRNSAIAPRGTGPITSPRLLDLSQL